MLLVGVFLMSTSLNIASTIQAYLAHGSDPNAENEKIVAVAKFRHLTKGYASYWNAGVNQYFANSEVLFVQTGCSPVGGLRPNLLLLNEQVLKRPTSASFYLFDPAATHCTDADLARFFGEPQDTVELAGQKRLLLYSYDIATRMRVK